MAGKRYTVVKLPPLTPKEREEVASRGKYIPTWGDERLAEWIQRDIEYWLHIASKDLGMIDYVTAEKLMDYLGEKFTPEYLARAGWDSTEEEHNK